MSVVDVACFATHDWRDSLRRWGGSYRAAIAAHPNIVPYLARGPGRRPAALAMADAVYGGLVKAGWPPARATHVGALMRYFVAGSALGSFARGFMADPEPVRGALSPPEPGAPARWSPGASRRGRLRP